MVNTSYDRKKCLPEWKTQMKFFGTLTKKIGMTEELAEYVENLHAEALDDTTLGVSKPLWEKEHHFLQIPLSEAKFLSLFIKATKAKRVLEIGTFRGWSAAWIAKGLPENGKLLTIDHDERIEVEAKELWQELRVTEKIDFKLEDAKVVLNDLKNKGEKFDLIFIDAHKAEYKDYLDLSFSLLNEGGVLLADNTLWAGQAAEDTDEPRANYMKDFNDHVFKTFGASACLIPAWDGVVMIVK